MEDIDEILEYERMIYSIIKKFTYYYDKDDLYQVGMMGLVKAYHNYIPDDTDSKFTTYAYKYIKGEVLKYIREDKNIKINKDLIIAASLIEQKQEELTQKLMRSPTLEELSFYTNVDMDTIIDAIQSKEFVRSLDYEKEDDMSLYNSVKVEEDSYKPEVLDLHNAIEELEEVDKQLIYYRYFNDKTQSEVSKKLGMSQVQVSRSEQKILTKLRGKIAA